VAMLHDGMILFHGTPEEIRRCEEPTVRTFIAGSMEWLHDVECGPESVVPRGTRRPHTM